MQFLKQSTSATLMIGPFIDDTDGKTSETGLTIAQADVRLSKNGGNMAQKNESTSCTHDELGVYSCPIDTTDTATLGRLYLYVHESGALPVWHEFLVVTANVWDTLCSTDQLDVNVTNIAGTSQTANDNGADINAILTDTGTTLPASISGLDTKLDTIDNYIDTEVAAILVDTAEIGTAGAGLTNVPWNSSWDAEVQSEVDDALKVLHLDHLLAASYDPASKPGTADALLNELIEDDSGVSRFTANALEQGPSAAAGDGSGLTAIPWNASWDAEVQSECTDALNAYDPPTKTEMDTAHALLATVAKQDVIDGIVDAILVDTGTTLDGKLNTIDDFLDTEMAAALADTNELQGDWANGGRLDLLIDGIKAVTDNLPNSGALSDLGTVLTDTNELQTDWANGGRLDLLLDAVKAQTDDQPAGFKKGVGVTKFPFLMIDSSDHYSPKTGLTVTVQISKDGGAFAAVDDGTATEISDGFYYTVMTATEMTADLVGLICTASGADQTSMTIKTSA